MPSWRPCDSSTSGIRVSYDLACVILPNCACFQLRMYEASFTFPQHIFTLLLHFDTTEGSMTRVRGLKTLLLPAYLHIWTYKNTRPGNSTTSNTVICQSWSGVTPEALWDNSPGAELRKKLFEISVVERSYDRISLRYQSWSGVTAAL
jgi:hypothetical protein